MARPPSAAARREAARNRFLAQPGQLIVEIADGGEPLWPQGFDPLNIAPLGGGALLHRRFLRLGNKAGTLELLTRAAMTEPAGAHPLFNGVRRVTLTGVASPRIDQTPDGLVTIAAEGLTIALRHARVNMGDHLIVVTIGGMRP